MRRIPAILLATALVSVQARAQLATITSQDFTGYTAASAGSSVAQLGSSDWWRIYSQPNTESFFNVGDGLASNYILKFQYNAAANNRGRTIVSDPISGNVGKVVFKTYLVKQGTADVDAKVSVFLGTKTEYKDCTGFPAANGVSPLFTPVTLTIGSDNEDTWVTQEVVINTVVDASNPLRVAIGRMENDYISSPRSGYDVYIDDIVVYEMPSCILESSPLTTTEGLDYAISGVTGQFNSIHPTISFSTIGTVSDVSVKLYYRFSGDTTWSERVMEESSGGVYVPQGGDLTVGTQSGVQMEMYVGATFTNEEGAQTASLTYTADSPLVLDILPRGIQSYHNDLVITGAFQTAMSLATNGVWVGGYERAGGVLDTTFRYYFGEGQSMSYGNPDFQIPFEKVVSGGGLCPAPTSIDRDVLFRFDETDGYIASTLYGEYQPFENWATTTGEVWSVVTANAESDSGVVTTNAQSGSAAMLLRAGDSLVIDKGEFVGVGEIGFWFRRAGDAAASLSLSRHRVGQAVNDDLETFTGLPTDRYAFVRKVLTSAQSPMTTDKVIFTANTDVYLDGVYVSDCSIVLFESLVVEPQPARQNTPISATATFRISGGGKLKADSVLLMYGQGNDSSCTTNEGYFVTTDGGTTWTVEIPEGAERSDADLYVYVTGTALDYRGANIGSATSPVQCIQIIPFSNVDSVSIEDGTDSTPMRLAADRLWKGAIPKPAANLDGATYWFLDSDNVKRGDADASGVPARGDLTEDAEFALTATISTALAFEYNEASQTYRIQLAHYDPMTNAPANPAWTRQNGAYDATGDAIKFQSNGYFISPDRPGVGQVMFWAARASNASVTYRVAVSKSANQNDWVDVPAANGGTGVVSGENLRFFSALIGDPEVRRVRVTFTGGPVFIRDAVVTASGSYVTMDTPQISIDDEVTYVDSSINGAASGQIVEYGGRPYVTVHLVPQNGATDIRVSVEAIMADMVDGVPVPAEGADVISVPMEGSTADNGETYTFRVWMPALTAGATAYRFVSDYDGEDATQTVFPKTANTWYSYGTAGELAAIREPDFSALTHDNSVMIGQLPVDNWLVSKAYLWRSFPTAIGFTADPGQTMATSRQAFHGIGRIYFRAFCMSPYGYHDLAIQMSPTGANGTWETINTVSVPYGAGTLYTPFSQFCIEVNDYGSKYIRIVRTSEGADDTDYIFVRDLVVTPPAANVASEIPSIIHPGYPSKNDDVTFAAHVENVYTDYPAVNSKVTLHWRRVFGSVAQAWNLTPMESADGENFSVTLPAMNPGRVEYFAEVSFSGASYRYTYINRTDGTDMPLFFYYAGDDTYLEADPRQGNESCTPAYLFSDVESPVEFTHTTQQRSLQAPTDYENVYLWFKVRAFESGHSHVQFVYTNALESVASNAVPTVSTNALQLIGDNLWLTTVPITNSIHYFGTLEGVAPYGGAGTTEYLAESTFWGDNDQETVNAPLASYAGTDETGPVEVFLGTTNSITMMVRFDANTGSYQIRRAAYQDFNDWGADTQYFEDSTGLYDVMTYDQSFDGSAIYPETAMNNRIMKFDNDTIGDYTEADYFTTFGWNLHAGSILRERKPRETRDLVGNVAARMVQGGFIGNEAGVGANNEGLDYVAMRARVSYGADGNTPYDRTGFAWEDYRLIVSNLQVSAISDAEPYVQVMAAYLDPYDYVALRLTQTATIDQQRGVLPHVRQDLIRVVNGVETVLNSTYTRKWNNGKGTNALTTNEGDTNNEVLELTKGDWVVEMTLNGGNVSARAFIPGGGSWTNNILSGAAATVGTVSCDVYDARANFRNFYIVQNGTSRPVATDNWYLGGPQADDRTKTRWILEMPSGKTGQYQGIARPIPTLSFTIGVAKADESATLPASTPYETVGNESVSSLSYSTVNRSVHYWGNAFVRIKPGKSDGCLVVDDVEVQSWRGRALPEEYPTDDRYWQVRDGVITTRNGSRVLALTTSRANPADRQMVSTPEMLDGLGTIAFNYEVVGGRVTFVVEYNSVGGAYSDAAGYTVVDTFSALNGEKGEVYRAIRESQTGKIRVRILSDRSDSDATLYLDNFFAKSFPPNDGRSWTAYNALIVAPTRNSQTDAKQFEEDVSTQTAFLNNAVDSDTRQNTVFLEHIPFIQSPTIDTGVGEIAFWYRAWNPQNPTPGEITFWVAEDGNDPDEMWRQITAADLARPERPKDTAPRSEWDSYYDKMASYTNQVAAFEALSNITNGDYQYFSAEICNDTNFVLRICSNTNGTQRVAIDNVIVTEPVRASIDVLDIAMFSADSGTRIPLGGEDVGFEVLLGNPRMNPTDIHVYADYYVGTNVWGVANWANLPETRQIELVQDADNQYLYRSSGGDLIPGLPVDSVVQYRIRVTYTGTFASPVTSAAFQNPEWYEPVDLNETYADLGYSPYYFVFSCPTGCVYINEFYPAGANAYNSNEFVEFIGPANASIAGWFFEIIDVENSRSEDTLVENGTYYLPAEAKFIAPEGSTHGWGFYVVGDSGAAITNAVGENGQVNCLFENSEACNLPSPGAIRLRRSMGAYVDRIVWGGSNAQNSYMTERGYRNTGTRSGWASNVNRREYVLDEDTEGEITSLGWKIPSSIGYTVGDMNSESAAELWGQCPYEIADQFANANAVALAAYFDKYAPVDFLCGLYLNDANELLKLSIDANEFTLGNGYSLRVLDGNQLVVVIDAAALSALNLSTNELHTITFDVDEGLDPAIELRVIDSKPESSGDKSEDVSIEIVGMEIVDGKVRITVAIVNNDAEKTVEGWSWGVKTAATLDALDAADPGDLTPLTDAAIEDDLTTEINLGNGDASFYKAVLDDGE